MGEINLDATQLTPVRLKLVDPDGAVIEYHGEAVRMTKPRMDMLGVLRKEFNPLRAKAKSGKATQADEDAAALLLAKMLDVHVRSTNGPMTIVGLWQSGALDFTTMQQLIRRLGEEASPPA